MSIRVDYNKLIVFLTEIFEKCGLATELAAIVAENLVMAESRGVRSHGLVQVKNYVGKYEKGLYNATPKIQEIKEAGGTLIIEGDKGPGAVCGKYAMRRTIERAKETGIALTVVRNSTHFGMAEYFAKDAVAENMIGLAFTNVSVPLVAPFGGYTKQLGTNPICIAVPAGEYESVIFDAATSEQAFNKVVYARAERKQIPLGWAVDGKGQPTTDPNAVIEEGALISFGGYKGYGLAFMVNILTGLLSGACLLKEADGTVKENENGVGFNFVAIDVSHFMDPEDFKKLVDVFVKRVKSSPQTEEDTPILVPGEPEHAKYLDALEHGIEIFPGVQSELEEVEQHLQTTITLESCKK